MIHLLDTDHITILQRGGEGYEALSRRLAGIAPDDYGTTVVNYEEQCRGWIDKINRANTPVLRVHSYGQLRETLHFFSSLSVWEYSVAADAEFMRLLQNKVRIGTKDLRIASVALANNATVLTRNTRDFGRVPGLLFTDWTI